MKNSKKTNTGVLLAVLIGLLIVAYKVLYVAPEDPYQEQNAVASERVGTLLREIESVNFNESVLSDPRFAEFKSIEIPLESLPIGKTNPFSLN